MLQDRGGALAGAAMPALHEPVPEPMMGEMVQMPEELEVHEIQGGMPAPREEIVGKMKMPDDRF
jgi:hypothetical protein